MIIYIRPYGTLHKFVLVNWISKIDQCDRCKHDTHQVLTVIYCLSRGSHFIVDGSRPILSIEIKFYGFTRQFRNCYKWTRNNQVIISFHRLF